MCIDNMPLNGASSDIFSGFGEILYLYRNAPFVYSGGKTGMSCKHNEIGSGIVPLLDDKSGNFADSSRRLYFVPEI